MTNPVVNFQPSILPRFSGSVLDPAQMGDRMMRIIVVSGGFIDPCDSDRHVFLLQELLDSNYRQALRRECVSKRVSKAIDGLMGTGTRI